MPSSIRIGNGCGFWGDNLDAPVLLAEQGRLDYLTLEYLAELTMSILALQKQRDPQAGYASDFLDVLGRLVPFLKAQPGLKIITNAGGMNPLGCARRARDILDKNGLQNRKIGAYLVRLYSCPKCDRKVFWFGYVSRNDTVEVARFTFRGDFTASANTQLT